MLTSYKFFLSTVISCHQLRQSWQVLNTLHIICIITTVSTLWAHFKSTSSWLQALLLITLSHCVDYLYINTATTFIFLLSYQTHVANSQQSEPATMFKSEVNQNHSKQNKLLLINDLANTISNVRMETSCSCISSGYKRKTKLKILGISYSKLCVDCNRAITTWNMMISRWLRCNFSRYTLFRNDFGLSFWTFEQLLGH